MKVFLPVKVQLIRKKIRTQCPDEVAKKRFLGYPDRYPDIVSGFGINTKMAQIAHDLLKKYQTIIGHAGYTNMKIRTQSHG